MPEAHDEGEMARTPRTRRDLALQEVGEEGLLYDREGAVVHILNRTALHAWRLCDGRHTVEEIVTSLVSAFSGAERDRVRRDVVKMLADFTERGLLERDQA